MSRGTMARANTCQAATSTTPMSSVLAAGFQDVPDDCDIAPRGVSVAPTYTPANRESPVCPIGEVPIFRVLSVGGYQMRRSAERSWPAVGDNDASCASPILTRGTAVVCP